MKNKWFLSVRKNKARDKHSDISFSYPTTKLSGLDHIFEKNRKNRLADKLKYYRYQDDILILAKTRWHLRKAIKIVKQHVTKLKLESDPGKTFIGRSSHGFDCEGFILMLKKSLESHGFV